MIICLTYKSKSSSTVFHLAWRGYGMEVSDFIIYGLNLIQSYQQAQTTNYFYFLYKYLNQFFNIAINILKPTLKSTQARQGPMNTQSLFSNIKPFNFKPPNKFYKYKIDSNLYLSIRVQLKGTQLTFKGSLHYLNGFQFEVSQKLWQLINQKVNLQLSQFLFMYDRSSSTVIIYSKIKIGKLINHYFQKVVKQLLQKICLEAKKFLQTLYSFGQFNFSDQFNFKQSLAESKFKRNFINNLQSKQTSQKELSSRDTYQESLMVDQSNEAIQSVKKRTLQVITQLKSLTDVPVRLQNGQKGIQFHLLNAGQSIIRTGGFFIIQKLLCKIYKKNQYSQESKNFQFSFDKQQSMFFESSIFMIEAPCQLDILVKKTLKQQKKDISQNLLKIQKQLAIIQQINNRKNLVKYYENSSNLKKQSQKATNLMIQEECNTQIISNTLQNLQIQSFDYEKPFKKQIFMQFIPHTLSDVTSKRSLSLDQIMSTSLQIVEAVRHLHQSYVIHRDLKPQNILIDFISNRTQFNVKVIDFAQSAIFYQQNRPHQKRTIDQTVVRQIFDRYDRKFYGFTAPYSPPECYYAKQNRLDKGINSFKIDSWSVAIILSQIYSGKQLINYYKAHAKDVVINYEKIPLLNYKSKSKRKGLKIWQEAINLLAIKNLTIKQQQRMSIEQIQKSLKYLQTQMKDLEDRGRTKR